MNFTILKETVVQADAEHKRICCSPETNLLYRSDSQILCHIKRLSYEAYAMFSLAHVSGRNIQVCISSGKRGSVVQV